MGDLNINILLNYLETMQMSVDNNLIELYKYLLCDFVVYL